MGWVTRRDESVVPLEFRITQIDESLLLAVARDMSGRVQVSAGVAARVPDGSTIDSLIKLADDALYEAKRNERNQVVMAAPSDAVERASRGAERDQSALWRPARSLPSPFALHADVIELG